MASRISPSRIEFLRIILTYEPSILPKISFKDGDGRKTAKKMQIREDGSVLFYCGSGPLWLQRCMNDYELVSILDIALRIADTITGSHGTRNEIAFDGITKQILDEAIKKKDLDCVIDILLDSMRNGSDGELHSKYINQENLRKYAKEAGIKSDVKVNVNGLYGIVGLRTSDGRVIPGRVRLGYDE